jgi:hypothetical protein
VTLDPTPRSTAARRAIAIVAAATLMIVTTVVVVTTSPTEDAEARSTSGAAAAEPLAYADLLLPSELSRAAEAAENAREVRAEAEQVRRFLEGAAAAEAERVAAEQAAAAAAAQAAAQRSAMGGGWAALRRCESGGNYGAVSANGTYRGAYQFSRSTWNSVASRSHPHLVGVDPAAAAPADQDAMALALYRSSGARPWPHCGRHL